MATAFVTKSPSESLIFSAASCRFRSSRIATSLSTRISTVTWISGAVCLAWSMRWAMVLRIRLWGIRWAASDAADAVGRATGAVGAAGTGGVGAAGAGGVAGLITGAWAGVDAGGVAVSAAVAAGTGAGAWTGEPDRYASMSRRMIRPPGPVPRIRFRSS